MFGEGLRGLWAPGVTWNLGWGGDCRQLSSVIAWEPLVVLGEATTVPQREELPQKTRGCRGRAVCGEGLVTEPLKDFRPRSSCSQFHHTPCCAQGPADLPSQP